MTTEFATRFATSGPSASRSITLSPPAIPCHSTVTIFGPRTPLLRVDRSDGILHTSSSKALWCLPLPAWPPPAVASSRMHIRPLQIRRSLMAVGARPYTAVYTASALSGCRSISPLRSVLAPVGDVVINGH